MVLATWRIRLRSCPASPGSACWNNLPQHFGTDASLDAATLAQVRNFIQDNAGSYWRVREAPPQDRITRSDWFLRKHREGEVPADVWKRASVKSPANCAACHRGAAQGEYDERGADSALNFGRPPCNH